jgi:hypothetical protein
VNDSRRSSNESEGVRSFYIRVLRRLTYTARDPWRHATDSLIFWSDGYNLLIIKENKRRVPGRGFEPRQENPAAIKVLARWDFLSYPESYPHQSRAAMRPLGIRWARMSRHRDSPSESNDIEVDAEPDAVVFRGTP